MVAASYQAGINIFMFIPAVVFDKLVMFFLNSKIYVLLSASHIQKQFQTSVAAVFKLTAMKDAIVALFKLTEMKGAIAVRMWALCILHLHFEMLYAISHIGSRQNECICTIFQHQYCMLCKLYYIVVGKRESCPPVLVIKECNYHREYMCNVFVYKLC